MKTRTLAVLLLLSFLALIPSVYKSFQCSVVSSHQQAVNGGDEGDEGDDKDDVTLFFTKKPDLGRYIAYTPEGGCPGWSHLRWSTTCAISEAIYLNRTFVFHDSLCISSTHSRQGREIVVLFSELVDLERMRREFSFIMDNDFRQAHNSETLQSTDVQYVTSNSLTSKELKETKANEKLLVVRNYESGGQWYDLCVGAPFPHLFLLYPSQKIILMAGDMAKELGPWFVFIHVRRGDKAQNKAHWPHLDADTQPENILKRIDPWVAEGTTVYVASNELAPNFFDPLKLKYRLFLWDSFKDLEAKVFGERAKTNPYLSYMSEIELKSRAKLFIPTFNDENPVQFLSDDNRHG